MRQVVHETIIKDIVDLVGEIKDIKGLDELLRRNKRGSMRSIAQGTSNLTLTFPMCVSDSLSIESSGMVSKAMERKQAQMIQLLLGAYQSKYLEKGKEFNPIEFLQQFHKNMNVDTSVTVDDALNVVDKVIKLAENAGMDSVKQLYISESEQISHIKDNRFPDTVLPDSINEVSVSDFKIRQNPRLGRVDIIQEGRTRYTNNMGFGNNVPLDVNFVSEPTTRTRDGSVRYAGHTDDELLKYATDNIDYHAKRDKLYWDQDQRKSTRAITGIGNGNITQQDISNAQFAKAMSDIEKNNLNARLANSKEKRDVERHEWDRNKIARTNTSQNIKDTQTKMGISQGSIAQLQNVDVKKANELVGTPIMVTVHIVRDGGVIDPVSFLIAVKSKITPLRSSDVVQRIINKNKDKNFFSKLIKVATGEISFVRDFLFAIDQIKVDALSQSRKGSSSNMWRVLERMALKSKINRSLGRVNDCMAITTLVISQEEVEYIKKYANLDVGQEGPARVILEAYNLLCFVIVDETNETAKFLFNTGNADMFEELSFNQLEREATDGSYRKMVNLISKIK